VLNYWIAVTGQVIEGSDKIQSQAYTKKIDEFVDEGSALQISKAQ
jgi:hypothetical protein